MILCRSTPPSQRNDHSCDLYILVLKHNDEPRILLPSVQANNDFTTNWTGALQSLPFHDKSYSCIRQLCDALIYQTHLELVIGTILHFIICLNFLKTDGISKHPFISIIMLHAFTIVHNLVCLQFFYINVHSFFYTCGYPINVPYFNTCVRFQSAWICTWQIYLQFWSTSKLQTYFCYNIEHQIYKLQFDHTSTMANLL